MTAKAESNQGTRRALKLLFALAGRSFDGVNLTSLAASVDQSAPTTLRDLQVLHEEGLVERLPSRDTHWRLSPRLVQIAIAHNQELLRLQHQVDEFQQRYSRTTS